MPEVPCVAVFAADSGRVTCGGFCFCSRGWTNAVVEPQSTFPSVERAMSSKDTCDFAYIPDAEKAKFPPSPVPPRM